MNSMSLIATMESNDICKLLQDEFIRRRKKNSAFSLRSFASVLGVDASLLSKIVRRKHIPSVRLVNHLGPKIGLRPKDLAIIRKSIQQQKLDLTVAKIQAEQDSDLSTSPRTNNDGASSVAYKQLDEDMFEILAGWLHFAIIELVKTSEFKNDSGWIAKRLRRHPNEVSFAIERLVRVGLLKIESGVMQVCEPHTTWFNNEYTSEARKRFQLEVSNLAVDALEKTDFSRRYNGSLTVAFSTALLPEVNKRIADFLGELDEFVSQQKEFDSVYQCTVGFFPLSEEIGTKKKEKKIENN